MLGTDAYSIALDAADIGRRHLSGQQRIFRKILEVAAAERVAVQVETRGKENVGAVLLDLLSHRGRQFFDQRSVPGGCEHGTYRESGSVKGLVSTGTCGIDADSGRTISKDGLGNTEAWDGTGSAGGAGDERLVGRRQCAGGHTAPAGAHQQRCLLLQGHGLEDLVDVVFLKFRLSKNYGCAQCQSDGEKESLHGWS